MKLFYSLLIFLLRISQYQFQSLSCRTNCSDDQCWREALTYRSSELVEQLFSFGSLTVHVDTFLRKHPDELNDTMKFLDEPLQNYLVNESKDSHLPIDLFTATKQHLVNACQNLTLTAIKDISELPSLTCSTRTCAGDILNYTVLFIVATTRTCNTKYGTMNCWQSTIDGFTYGLSTTMVDYCQVTLQLSQIKDEKQKLLWYNTSRDILTEQINAYNLDKMDRQLSKHDVEQIATTLLNKCFNSPLTISSPQPTCPSCSKDEKRSIKQWNLICLISLTISVLLIFAIIVMYTFQTKSTYRSYQSIG
ncbi:unnamed protein product [Adineta ricciae]|uniref:Uncharacterized protein n=1 Tax=Adineta ricciae TaxID=249248 RepID=A0A815Y155_ADIRI|nr:unnamed protein product [Adineta ricciae]